MDQLLRASEALHKANRSGHLGGVLIPAMYGCPDCKTAWVVISPTQLGPCTDCGMTMAILTADQVAAVVGMRSR